MFGIREHNRVRLAQRKAEPKKMIDYGTQVEEKSTRTIGTMSEPVVTRNAGNEAQPQSSATQTSNLFRQPQQHGEEDERDFPPTTSSSLRNDTRTNGYHPSQRITSADRRNRYVPSSAMDPHYEDHFNHDQHRPRHRSHYHDDPRDQYTTPQDGYGHYPSSRTRPRRESPASPSHHTPPPPVEYRSSSPSHNHHRSPATRRSRSRSPSTKKHIATSTDRRSSRSPPSQHRSRPAQRSTSPPTSKHHVSSSPPAEYRSSHPAKDDSRRSKHQPQKASVATDTSLDRMARSQHREGQSESPTTREFGTATSSDLNNHHHQQKRSPYSDYQKLDSNPPNQQDHRKKTSYEDDQPPSTRRSYRLRPEVNNSFTNYEEIPSKHDESTSPPNNRSFDRSDDRRRPAVSPKTVRRSAGEEQYPKTTTANDETPNDDFHRQLPRDDSISIRSTPLIQPDSLPGSRRQKKSPAQKPLHHGQQRQTPPRRDSSLLNFGTTHVEHQPSMNEVAMPFNIRYLPDQDDDDDPTGNFNFRTSTLKRDALRDNANRILLLPVLNSSRTYVFEKQSLSGDGRQMRQSRTNGNFYLATSPILHSLNSSFHEGDPDDLTGGHALRTQVA